jgi:hypothetical protein
MASPSAGPLAQEIVIETPLYSLTWSRICFGLLQVKAYTKGEYVLRFEVTVHNAEELRVQIRSAGSRRVAGTKWAT